jgi:hypothetical protein
MTNCLAAKHTTCRQHQQPEEEPVQAPTRGIGGYRRKAREHRGEAEEILQIVRT